MMQGSTPASNDLAALTTDALLYALLQLTRREQWEANPLRFGHEAFAQHFRKPSAPMHAAIMQALTGSEASPVARVGESETPIPMSLPFAPSVSAEHFLKRRT